MHSEHYLDFYRSERDKGAYIILDNGTAEGHTSSYDQIEAAIELLAPNEVVLPDAVNDNNGTYRASREFLDRLLDEGPILTNEQVTENYEWIPRFMFVAQGSDTWDFMGGMGHLNALLSDYPTGWIKSIGISKFMQQHTHRMAALAELQSAENIDGLDIHLLGVHTDPWEPFLIERMWPGWIRSVDTSMPFVLTFFSKTIWDTREPLGERIPMNDTFCMSPMQEELLQEHIRAMDCLVKGEQPDA